MSQIIGVCVAPSICPSSGSSNIVTGAHGYETLCTNGYNVRYNKAQQLVESCEKIAEGKLPVTCPVCFTIWQDVHRFTHVDFDTQSGKSDFIDTCHSEIITGHVSITGKK
ncbi:hypothetical protein [Klebsiella pneumoniae]